MKPEKIVYSGGVVEYRLKNGQLHREDGPARIDGMEKAWYQNGLLHHLDGPAVIWGDGSTWWYIEGIRLTKEDHKIARKVFSGEYPFKDLPLLVNHERLKYFALRRLSSDGA